MKGSGSPLTPDQCFMAAAVCGAITLWLLLAAHFPSFRFGFAWEGVNRPMSGLAFIASAIFTASWVVVLLATGLRYTPVTDHGFWFIGAGFVAVVLAFLRALFARR